jgi:hypothetical protein
LPAQAGPFDLGKETLRGALRIDPRSARIKVRFDPLPQILSGLPLDYRAIRLRIDRRGFIQNPTSCTSTKVVGIATADDGSKAPLASPFRVTGCGRMPFQPRLSLRLSGGLARNGHPSLRAVLRMRADEERIGAASLTLPPGELLDFHHLDALCSNRLPPERCPPGSRLGFVRLWSPALDGALEGPVYLREPTDGLPDLLAEVRNGGVHLILHGRTTAPDGRLQILLDSLPDLPLTKAILTLAGGGRGILVNSVTLCDAPRRAETSITSQSGVQQRLQPLLRLGGSC